ncbi:C4-dicarboxylate TRAP transporter substrate-binding protein [Oceanobacter mangrovi]|uniref:C4-dicarboxylate TRAP transporter substrate-binding protein n=1 Tax=Oceanobacter mangrovi TaxID=2862510 RepID=UPI001C8DBB0F|nr:C4-dicarboxylate TRAP transporter substrate-binding protein [Oceanobacter mangrovi]
MKTGILSLVTGLTAAVVLAQTPAVNAKTIRAVSGFGPAHVLATTAYPKMSDKLEEFTDGKWKIRDTPSGLLSIGEMNEGLKNGVAEMGTIIMPYFAADYTESALVAELSIVGTDNRAIASAVTEYIATCDECQAEFKKNGQVYTGSDATVPYELLTTKAVHSSDDLSGMRVRTAGSVFTRFVADMGGVTVQMPSSEIFEGLSSGVLAGTYSSAADLKNARLYDVVKYVTNIHQGVFNASAFPNVGNRLWSKMDDKERHALIHAAQYAQVASIYGWRDTLEDATREGKKAGIQFIDPDPSLKAKAEQFKQDHLATVAKTLEQRGVKNAQAKVDRYIALVEKWNGLVAGVSTQDELAELRYREIWAKRDLSQYGL